MSVRFDVALTAAFALYDVLFELLSDDGPGGKREQLLDLVSGQRETEIGARIALAVCLRAQHVRGNEHPPI